MNPSENPSFLLQATYALYIGRYHEGQDQQSFFFFQWMIGKVEEEEFSQNFHLTNMEQGKGFKIFMN